MRCERLLLWISVKTLLQPSVEAKRGRRSGGNLRSARMVANRGHSNKKWDVVTGMVPHLGQGSGFERVRRWTLL